MLQNFRENLSRNKYYSTGSFQLSGTVPATDLTME